MTRLVLVVILTAAVATPAGAGIAATWRVIGSGSATGALPIVSASGDVKRPLGLRIRALGTSTATVSAVYSCSRDLKIRPSSTVALTVAGSDTCSVVASGSNDGGKLTLKIEALK